MRRLILFVGAPLFLVAASLLALSPAGASGHHITGCHGIVQVIHKTTVRTRTSVTVTERVAVRPRPGCRTGAAGRTTPLKIAQTDKCDISAHIDYKTDKSELNGQDWTSNCTPNVSACAQGADMLWKTPGGQFTLLKAGSQTSGCVQADYAWVNVKCYSDPVVMTYEDQGTFTIVWDDGYVYGPATLDSNTYTFSKQCG